MTEAIKIIFLVSMASLYVMMIAYMGLRPSDRDEQLQRIIDMTETCKASVMIVPHKDTEYLAKDK